MQVAWGSEGHRRLAPQLERGAFGIEDEGAQIASEQR